MGPKNAEEDKTKPVQHVAKIPLRGPSGLRKTPWMINSFMFIDFLWIFPYLSFPVDIYLIDSWLQITLVQTVICQTMEPDFSLCLGKMHKAFDSFRRFRLNKL